MASITKNDIEDRFGIENVALWSQMGNRQATDNKKRIDESIVQGVAFVEDRFRCSKYALPLTGPSGLPAKVKDWMAKAAGIWLWENRGRREGTEGEASKDAEMAATEAKIEQQIDSYLAGSRELPANLTTTGPSSPTVV